MRAQRLLHIHLPSQGPTLYPPYTIASQLQEHLRRRQLDFKDANANHQTPPGPHPPPPTVVSFTPLPTYTLGRRQTTPLSPAELARLQAPLFHHGQRCLPVTVLPSPRGGLTTYHGPGQIVLWPVMDLRSRYHKQFTVRCYSRLLETTTIATLAKLTTARGLALIQGFTTDDPGVWVNDLSTFIDELPDKHRFALSGLNSTSSPPPQGPAKIAALGVHLRRHISALGTAINVDMPGPELRDEHKSPWARFVPCGLEGKIVTSVQRELRLRTLMLPTFVPHRKQFFAHINQSLQKATEKLIAERWVDELSGTLGCDGVDRMSPQDVAELVTKIYEPSEGQNLELERKYLEWLQGMYLQTAGEKTRA
ncbi:putative octanoyltransferase [Rhypophila decipiens]